MAALLALTAAAAYGAGDFLGGIATRRESATAVVLWSHMVGLLIMLLVAPLIGGELTGEALVVGGAAGLVGAAGVAIFYHALSLGSMSVVAPVAGLLSAAIPVLAGIAGGERPPVVALVGIVLALGAITLVSREGPAGDDHLDRAVHLRALGLAVVAGVGFGLFFVALEGVSDGTGLWPLVGARIASVAMFSTLGLTRVITGAPPRAAAWAAVGAGVLDASANAFYLVALSHGLLSIVAVLSALYPAGTVLLARLVLRERMTRLQQTGLAVAGVATLLIVA
jgi:drug/metabolite transporter (DMT)-like permease